ncbi:MAG: lactate utilization protein [Phycisphaerae bacterium]|nr:lactate utilization protein [Phycisphaerae bacterium]
MAAIGPTPRPDWDLSGTRRLGPQAELVSVFAERAGQLGMLVSRCNEAVLPTHVAGLIAQYRPRNGRVKVLLEPTLYCHASIAAVLEAQASLLDPNDGDEAMFSADVGITGVAAAVAETGSLVCTSGPQQWRGLSLIPPVHVAIVRADRIVPDLLDVLATASPDPPAALTLISGPSKTADIEGILITGVHGPGHVHVVVTESSERPKNDAATDPVHSVPDEE